ncbi:MAG TPA: calcium-binding protein [Actinomycetota bacterium]|nr:calcium-binding protein [Actinomycetota bacterium]
MRLVLSTVAVTSLLVIGASSAPADPVVGKPPAPGYPPCTHVGDDGPDVIKGTKKRDVICPDEGNDVIYGRGGNDVLMGGLGTDRLYGGPGDDEFHAWKGNDKLFGEEGNDRLNGEIGNDLLVGGPGRDVLIGASEDDCLVATDGEVDRLKGNLGHDRYEADDNDVIDGSNESKADCWARG